MPLEDSQKITFGARAVRAGCSCTARTEARRLAAQIVEILNGGNPAEMPFFQENHFVLVINLKAAKELGLEIPLSWSRKLTD
jgi:ABC-type uncharacterized transport system substrate-binding protein